MKFAIAKEHRDFFQKNGWIEFEEFFSSNQIAQLNQAIDQTLSSRLKIPVNQLPRQTAEGAFLQGRDLWRANQELGKFVAQPRLAEIASELIEKKPLRLGYDQFFPPIHQVKYQNPTDHIYSTFIDQTASLEALSSLEGLACGLIIPLGEKKGAAAEGVPSGVEGIDIFAGSAGHALFFRPEAEVNWKNLYAHHGQSYYLIAYTQLFCYYRLEPRDPHTHSLKSLGYVFTDKLNDKWNPVVFR